MKYYTAEQIKKAYEIVYGHEEGVRYEYNQNGYGKAYMHGPSGSNYVDMSRHIDYLQKQGRLD